MDDILRVASYNLRDFKDDAHAAARVVRAINADVLCLQEVPRHLLSSYRTVSFAARCGLYWSGGHRGSGGTTVLSSLRVDAGNVEHRPLKVGGRLARERGYALTKVRLPGHKSVLVVSIHLSLDAGERERHAAAVLGAVPGDVPLIVAGDLNEGSEGRAWKALGRRLRDVTSDAPTFPAANPHHRTDVIFASQELSVVPGGPLKLDPHDLVTATDHLPVWVDLDLSGVARE
ncbi:MAG: endonuclease/exonuclease/phosphatase family protein [Dermatophilaceae bacterium]